MSEVKKSSFSTYRRLLKVAQQYWLIFMVGVFGTIMLSIVDAAFMWLIEPIVNKGFIDRDATFIKWLPLIVIMVFLVRGIAGFSSNYFIGRVARSVVMDFRRAIFDKLLCLPAKFFDRNSSGHLLATIIYNVEQVAQASSMVLVSVLREVSLLIGLIVVMFVLNWRLTLLALVISPLLAWVIKWTSKRLRRLSFNVQESVGDVTKVADESIQGYKVIRLFGGEAYERSKFWEVTAKNRFRELKIIITNSISTSVVQLLVAIPIAITLFFALMPSFHVSAGAFAAFAGAMIRLLQPIRRITNMNSDLQKGIAGADSVFQILDQDAEMDSGLREIERVKGAINYKHVEFSYDSAPNRVLKDISFNVSPGQTVAIVGRSGSGKSTLVNLLTRFYDIEQGEISVDGVSIRDFTLANLRQQFALVSQNITLFDDSVAKNIAYGMEEVSDSDIIDAATAAHAMEFINELPDGIHTRVGENGLLLSGGQRQRIAIARALLKNAPIVILDEATSALDTHSERHIQAALEGLMQKCTTLVIAHRLSTIENADWIMVLEAGSIIEKGTHVELLAKGGAYADLHRLQFKDPTEIA